MGKTTFLERICGKPNLAKRKESINISTGYNAPVPVVVCQCDKERTEVTTAIVSTCDNWKVLKSNEETAAVMFKIKKCVDVTEAQYDPTEHVHTVRKNKPASTSSIHNIQGEQNSISVESPTVFTSPDPLTNLKVFTGHTKALVKPTASNDESNAYKPLIKPISFDKFDDYVKHVLKEQGLPSIDQLQNMSMVYFIDTGGQPEFHEILPVILRGSSIFLVFFSLEKGLNEKVQVWYQLKADHSSYKYEASCSSIEIVYQLISSFYSANYDVTKETSNALLSPLIEEGKSRFRAAIIATYADKLKYKVKDIDINEEIKSAELRDQYLKVNEELKKALHSSFSEAGFLTQLNADSELLFFPIDNMDGTDEEILDVKEKLTPLIRNFPDHKLPRSVAIFHLVLQHNFKTTGVCSIQEAIDLGHECGIEEANINVRAVLRYFHKNLGTILFYDTVNCSKDPKSQQCINGIVVCDPNILYECITNIIIVSFAGIGPDTGHAKHVRETGEISIEVIDDVLQKRNQSKFKSHYVICLLKWFKLLHEITKDDEIVYFMPCLLEPAKPDPIYKSYKELDTQTSIPSLLIYFKGGYVPVGVFSALVVTLAGTWEPDEERFRNSVQFLTGNFAIKLVVYFSFIEIRVPGPVEISEDLHEHCLEFKHKIESSLKTLPEEIGLIRSNFDLGYFCPGSKDKDIKLHACLRKNNNTMRCSQSPKCREQPYDIPNGNKIWFDDWPGLEKVRLYILYTI